MINFTIISLTSSLFISQSPAFTSNNLSIINSNFKFFISSALFYNQQVLLLQKSIFNKGIGGIVRIKSVEGLHEFKNGTQIQTIRYDNNNAPNKMSVSITFCLFDNLNGDTIFVECERVSIYITRATFTSCSANEGIMNLRRARCVTITHTCSLNSFSNNYGVFRYDCMRNDFLICIYNTFANTKSNGDGSFDFYAQDGDQHYRCLNTTNCDKGGFQINAPRCLSFGIISVIDCSRYCFALTGYDSNVCQDRNLDKYVEMVNFFTNNQHVMYMQGPCNLKVTFTNCVILSGYRYHTTTDQYNNVYHHYPELIQYDGDTHFIVTIKNCIISFENYNNPKYSLIDPITVTYSSDHLTQFPHYTYEGVCDGTFLGETAAYACNEGNCIDLVCNHTIGFPDDVVEYETFYPKDWQTESFTPSIGFSKSNLFSYSEYFSNSHDFSFSSYFSKSLQFSNSNEFSKTSDFTKTTYFTKSDKFSKSELFSETADFTRSTQFSNSMQFSETAGFTKTEDFSKTTGFTKTNDFSQTTSFSRSDQFSESHKFTPSDFYDRTHTFKPTESFSQSNGFSTSLFFFRIS